MSIPPAARPCRVAPEFLLAALLFTTSPHPAHAKVSGVPDASKSFFVPQAGNVATPAEGTLATRFFRACPNNDGSGTFLSNARIKVVVLDLNGNPIGGVAAADVCVLFNGGTSDQGFFGIGADSIVANSALNNDPVCPDVRCIEADGPTDIDGVTYITFAGATPGSPGVSTRDPSRKWGHFDAELPVFVMGYKIQGRLTSGSAIGSYSLLIKNVDLAEGLGIEPNEGAVVTIADIASVMYAVGTAITPVTYWFDLDFNGVIGASDFNLVVAHFNHDCDTPLNP